MKLEQGDSDLVHTGNGTGGSRSITASGMAIVEASRLVIEKGKRAAAHLMEAAEGDIEFGNGRFTIAGTDRSIDIIELARRLRENKMPEGVPSSLDVDHTTEPVPSTFPNGCHVAEVEIDPETGIVQIVRYTGVNDFGTIVNPMLVAGQLHGGVAQGIGQAFMECVSYDASGQPITGSFMDYALPRAEDIPLMEIGDHPVPAKSNPLGHQGLRRSRLRRLSLHARQRGARRAVRIRHHAHRHAADAGTGLARDQGCEDEGGVRHYAAARRLAQHTAVIARLDRAIQYSGAVVIEPQSRGVLDPPPSRGMTIRGCGHVVSCLLRRRLLARLVDRDVPAMGERRPAIGDDERVEFDEAMALLLVIAGHARARRQSRRQLAGAVRSCIRLPT